MWYSLFDVESAYFMLLVRDIDSTIFLMSRIFKLRDGCRRMKYRDIWSYCIGDNGMDGKHHISTTSVEKGCNHYSDLEKWLLHIWWIY